MKKIVFIYFIFLPFISAAANIDSLKTVLKTKKLTHQEKAQVLKDLSFAYCFINPDSGIYFARQMLALAAANNNARIKAKGQAMMATNYYVGLRYDSAKYYFARVITYGEKHNDLELLSSAYNNLGLLYLDVASHKLALKYLQKALEARIQKKDKKAICESYDNIGLVFQNVSDYPTAIKYHFKALRIAEELNDNNLMSYCYNNIAGCFSSNENIDKAQRYYFKSLHCIQDTGAHYELALAYTNIALNYNHLNMSKAAWHYMKKALRHSADLGELIPVATAYNNLGTIYYNANDSLLRFLGVSRKQIMDSALHYVRLSVRAGESGQDLKQRANALLNLSQVMYTLKDFTNAKESGIKALEFAKSADAKNVQLKILYHLAELNKKMGSLDDAYEFLNAYTNLREKIYTVARSNEITSGELKYEFSKKQVADSLLHQQRIAQQKAIIQEKESRMYILYGGLLVFLVFSIYLYTRIKLIRNQKKTIEEQKLMVEQKQKEVIDSIYYAKRIQQALLPSQKYIARVMNKIKGKQR
ncbi:MAG TPA: tetratricopeptide repeat protein [Flavobacteriales bacterium]|nr:tetratricopeptide repeat protein [Flavobacteriales bacterium]